MKVDTSLTYYMNACEILLLYLMGGSRVGAALPDIVAYVAAPLLRDKDLASATNEVTY